MAEAHAEKRHLASGLLDQIDADAGVVRRAGARGEHDGVRPLGHDVGGAAGIVADHLDGRTQLSQIMEEVVGEAVIIIDEDEHRFRH